jgi:hypothetical protein
MSSEPTSSNGTSTSTLASVQYNFSEEVINLLHGTLAFDKDYRAPGSSIALGLTGSFTLKGKFSEIIAQHPQTSNAKDLIPGAYSLSQAGQDVTFNVYISPNTTLSCIGSRPSLNAARLIFCVDLESGSDYGFAEFKMQYQGLMRDAGSQEKLILVAFSGGNEESRSQLIEFIETQELMGVDISEDKNIPLVFQAVAAVIQVPKILAQKEKIKKESTFFQTEKSTVELYRKSDQQFSFMIKTESVHGVAYSEYKLDFGAPSLFSSSVNDALRKGKPELITISNQASYDARISELSKSGYGRIETVETSNMDAFVWQCNKLFSDMAANADIYDNLHISAKQAGISFNFYAPAPDAEKNNRECLIL